MQYDTIFLMEIDFDFEKNLKLKNGYEIIAGVDEAGRGPLAGPVTAAALVFNKDIFNEVKELGKIKDSKLLSAKERGNLYGLFCHLKNEGIIDFAFSSVFPKTVDNLSIQNAAVLAMQRSVKKLANKPDYAVIDKVFYKKRIIPDVSYVTMKKADAIVPSCAAASIVAKVRRDKTMMNYHKKYPEYRFDLHKGYGTKLHYELLQKHGPSPIHRKSFRLS